MHVQTRSGLHAVAVGLDEPLDGLEELRVALAQALEPELERVGRRLLGQAVEVALGAELLRPA